MEQNYNQNQLFSLTIDPVTKAHLTETAKWARFLAIIGMVFMVLAAIGIIVFAYTMSQSMSSFEDEYGGGEVNTNPFGSFGMGFAAIYIVMLVIWFFPLLYLLRFANGTKRALNGNDQQALNVAFQNLKVCLRYVGIITIIFLVFYAIAFLLAILGSAVM